MRYNESLTFSPMPNTSTQKRSAPEAGVTLGATINSRPCFIYESDLQVGSLCIRIDYPRVWMSRPSERCVLGIPLYVGPILVRQYPHSFQQECKNVDRPRARRISY